MRYVIKKPISSDRKINYKVEYIKRSGYGTSVANREFSNKSSAIEYLKRRGTGTGYINKVQTVNVVQKRRR